MLEGVVPFPPEFAARYRARGYWRDRSLAAEFADVFARHADHIAVIDRDRRFTYADIDRASTNLALNLLDLGLKPLDRVVVQLPNVEIFASPDLRVNVALPLIEVTGRVHIPRATAALASC